MSERGLVERREPGQAPFSFRIWAFGPNEIDGEKAAVFSDRSAEMLIAEQTARARLYSFDFDHRSMLANVSPEAGKSAGWHTLEVRNDEHGSPELWAVGCDWTADARAGLEADPPEWRYFSPCYEVDPTTREVVSYVGCALTNNPLTRGIPALASAVTDAALSPPTLLEAARAVVDNARDQGRDDCMDDLVDEQHIERLRQAIGQAAAVPTPALTLASPPAAASAVETRSANPGRIALARARLAILRSRI